MESSVVAARVASPRACEHGEMMSAGLTLAGVVLALVAVFYAFNAYIQLRERGFAEAMDLPIAVVAGVLALGAFWWARRARRVP